MKMNPLISVIIPIYKVEDYLDECVQSVIHQTYKNLEIILVNDGSPDKCPQICDEYAKLDNRIIVIHKKNGGLSDARNAGLQIATGEYIQFLDADDILEKQKIEIQIGVLQKYNYPSNVFASCGWKHLKDTVYEVNDNQKKFGILIKSLLRF
ncbi:MAG: glycosyltransferase family 2 protein [Parabacteroides sp.]|nr:glycosyltransferase family 2 protein [Parabacteroides sp.]